MYMYMYIYMYTCTMYMHTYTLYMHVHACTLDYIIMCVCVCTTVYGRFSLETCIATTPMTSVWSIGLVELPRSQEGTLQGRRGGGEGEGEGWREGERERELRTLFFNFLMSPFQDHPAWNQSPQVPGSLH